MSSPIVRVGDHIELHPGTDRWMRGDKFGTVTSVSKAGVGVKFDRSGQTKRVAPSRIGRLNGVFVDGVSIPAPKRNSRKVANPSASCPRQSSKFNAYQGRTVKYRKKSYEVEGCGIGRTAKRSIGKQEEGTYALRALKTGKKKYVAKRVIRDLAYHRGGKAILGMPKRKKAVKNPSKRGKLHGAAKAEVVARMAAGRRRAGR